MAASGILWRETFTGTTGNPELNTHAPDVVAGGATSGLWQGTAGIATINSTTNAVQDGASNNGNRRFTRDLGTAEYTVEGNFTLPNAATTTYIIYCGLVVRATDGTGAQNVECRYNTSGNKWEVNENFAGGRTLALAEPWPGGTVRLRAVVSDAEVAFYANGVRKLTLPTTPNAGTGRFCGVTVGNASNVVVGETSCSFYEIRTLPVPAAIRGGNAAVMRATTW